MSPMFLMVEKIIAPLNIPKEKKIELSQCLDLAYSIGAGDMASKPEMYAQALQIFDKRIDLIKKLNLFTGE